MDKLLLAKLQDTVEIGKKRAKFLGFLSPAEAFESKLYLEKNCKTEFMIWGGYDNSERVLVAVFPDYLEPDTFYFPLIPLTVNFREEFSLSHRDFLGALMALGIVRASIGDILIEDGRAVIFVKSDLSEHIKTNLFKIGRVGVKISEGYASPLPQGAKFEELSRFVASERIDCIVSALCGLSREKAARVIAIGNVNCNYKEVSENSFLVQDGAVISIRSYGKFVIDSVSQRSKKGRIILKYRRFI